MDISKYCKIKKDIKVGCACNGLIYTSAMSRSAFKGKVYKIGNSCIGRGLSMLSMNSIFGGKLLHEFFVFPDWVEPVQEHEVIAARLRGEI